MLSGLGISFQNLYLLHFDKIISLKSLSINLFLLARLNVGLQMERPRVQASQKALRSEKEREREREEERERKRERERRLFKQCQNISAGTVLQRCSCLSGVATYLRGTVLQGCSCLSSVPTYLPAMCCRGAAV